MLLRTVIALALLAPWVVAPVHAEVTEEGINSARYEGNPLPAGRSALSVRLQILLDRAHVSPGVIDGYYGENVQKAVDAFRAMNNLSAGELTRETWDLLDDGGEVLQRYTIASSDLEDLVERVPEDYAEMADMDWLGHTTVEEKLAERFHMDIELLRDLNPDARFEEGDSILVAAPGKDRSGKVERIEVDRTKRQLRAYDASGAMLSAYPVTIGSTATPSPSGSHEVTSVTVEPPYSYRPDENFQQGDNTEPLELPPGPNGPVGIVWISLSEPTYGIHGTAEPSQIDKTQSHGCVRMTNWDALELADMVQKGVQVEFVGE